MTTAEPAPAPYPEGARRPAWTENLYPLIDASHDAIVVMDPRGCISAWNRAATRLFGWERDEAVGQPVAEVLVPPEKRAAHTGGWERRRALRQPGPAGTYELEALRRDGSRVAVSIALSAMGEGATFVAFIRDNTQSLSERQRQQELARANEFTELVIKNTGLAVATIGLNGEFLSANDRTCELLGYSRDELLTRTVQDVLPAEEVSRVEAAFGAAAAAAPVSRVEATVLRSTGERRHVAFGLSPMIEEGKLVGFVGAAEDVTDARRTQEALANSQKLESLASLAGGVAHDFNNLLTTILGNVAIVRTLPANDPLTAEALEDIETAGRQAAELARQMLAYAGKAGTKVGPADASELVKSMEPLLRAVLPRNVRVEARHEGPAPIQADVTQIRQVVLNIAVNASEAMGPEGGVLEVQTGVTELDERRLALCVGGEGALGGKYAFIRIRDDGPGMTDDVRRRVFDPFFTTRFTGRGLGLSAVFGIVRGHHGVLDVQSQPGEGATFTVYLPTLDDFAGA